MNLFFMLLICLAILNACTVVDDRSNPVLLTPAVPELGSDITQVVLLGTGTPNTDPERSGSAVAIVVNGISYLVDCGPGIVRRAVEAYQGGVKALAVENLCHIFITHLHSDHTLGYPDLIFTPWVLHRKSDHLDVLILVDRAGLDLVYQNLAPRPVGLFRTLDPHLDILFIRLHEMIGHG